MRATARKYRIGLTVTTFTICWTQPSAAQMSVRDISATAAPSVYQIITELGDGTGFLVDVDRGLVLTNAHVTAGQDTVGVKLDPTLKVLGVVVFEDRSEDIAVVRIHPIVVAGRTALVLDPNAVDALQVGDPVVAMGYPLGAGVVTTTGIVARKGANSLVVDARVSPGVSGGPLFGPDGTVVGINTYLSATSAGGSYGGTISPSVGLDALAAVLLEGDPPSSERIPVLPTDAYPLLVLQQAVLAAKWPTELYDISRESVGRDYDVRIFTPPLRARLGAESPLDLRYWTLEAGSYPPVVIVRVQPRVGQSGRSFFGNLLLGVVAGATDSPFLPIYEAEAKGQLKGVTLQGRAGVFRPIQIKRSGGVQDGVGIQVAHIILSPNDFRPDKEGSWFPMIINIWDADQGIIPWSVPVRTMQQIHSDFEVYLRGR